MSDLVMPSKTMNQLRISVGETIKSKKVEVIVINWVELCDILKNTIITNETQSEYKAMDKATADSIKDVGYIICGTFKDDTRKKINLEGRCAIVLDMDFATKRYHRMIKHALKGTAYVIHSTHKHTPDKPRLRIVIPLSRVVTPEEYEPLSRKIADTIGMKYFDDTTYQASRPMHKPSTSKDGEYIYYANEGNFLDADEVLNQYKDWKDVSAWPVSPDAAKKPRASNKVAGNPKLKPGLIGAFCRTYSIRDVLKKPLSKIYTQSEDQADRYTYIKGTTANGAVVYDNLFLYSHHNSDPACGESLNAFDLMRVHKFGHLDKDTTNDTPINKRPSYLFMLKLCNGIQKVIDAERDNDAELIKAFNKRYVFVEKGSFVADLDKRPHSCVLELKDHTNSTANQWVEIDAGTESNPNKTRRVALSNIWLSHADRKMVAGTQYYPGMPRIFTGEDDGLDYANVYGPAIFTDTGRADLLKPFTVHMDYIFPYENEREWFIDWMAYNLQFPERRCKVTPMHVSLEFGTGRGWIVELMEKLLGRWNCTKVTMGDLMGEKSSGAYHEYLYQSLFCAIEEVKETDKKYSVSAKIRALLTEGRLPINLKYGMKGSFSVFTNFMMMSNHADATVIPM